MSRHVPVELTNMCMIYNGSQVLVQNRCESMGWPGITFPGGHIEHGESVTASVLREVFEETGLKIVHPTLCGIKQWLEDDGSRYIVFLYKCNEYSGEIKSSEEGEVFWVECESLPGMNLSNGMKETLSVFFDDSLSELSYYRDSSSKDLKYRLE